MSREDELVNEGWEKRSVLDEPRLSEVVELYTELGYEVLLEAVDLSGPECTRCFEENPDKFRVVYTRPAKPEDDPP